MRSFLLHLLESLMAVISEILGRDLSITIIERDRDEHARFDIIRGDIE